MRPFEIFLSHQNLDRLEVVALEADLRRRGVLSWRDRKDLRLGDVTDDAIRVAIERETEAFAMYATARLCASRYVWEVEWPPAHDRHHAERAARLAAPYPIVPLFVVPAKPADLAAAATTFGVPSPLFANGEHLDPADPGTRRAVARLLLRTALQRRAGPGPLRIHLTTFGVPADIDADLVVDWTDDLAAPDVPWHALREASLDLAAELVVGRRLVEISVSSRLTAAFMLGNAFPRKSGITVAIKDWPTVDRNADGVTFTEVVDPAGDAGVAAVDISLVRRVGVAAREAVQRLGLRPSRSMTIGRVDEDIALHPAVATSAMETLGRTLKDLRDDGVHEVHVFLASPAPVATLLGTAVSSGPALTLYHTVDAAYVRTYRLPA